jgi:hypothetical protein
MCMTHSMPDMLHSMYLEVFDHPSYDQDLTQRDFYMLISLKEFLKDHRFTWSKDI